MTHTLFRAHDLATDVRNIIFFAEDATYMLFGISMQINGFKYP
jgi:hypothetical protein